MSQANIKGITFFHLKRFVSHELPDGALDAIADSVGDEARRALMMPNAGSWYPLRHLVEIERAVVDRYWDGDVTRATLIGKHDLQASIMGVYRVFLRILSPVYLVEKAGKLWHTYMDAGEMLVEASLAEHRADVRVRGVDMLHPVFCHDVRGSVIGALEACGAKQVDVEHTRCSLDGAPDCAYTARWHG